MSSILVPAAGTVMSVEERNKLSLLYFLAETEGGCVCAVYGLSVCPSVLCG